VFGAVSATYSDVKGGFAGAGNQNQDPLFLNPAAGDFGLQPGSPCIDKARPGPITGTVPGQTFVPGFGTVFLDLSTPVSVFPWAGTPSSFTFPVPPGSVPGDAWILQEAAVLPGGGATLSNAAPTAVH
jgi:hypothetical protein